MAKVIDESLKKQLSKKMVHFLKYFPRPYQERWRGCSGSEKSHLGIQRLPG